MKKITYEITSPLGMHARPAAFVAQACVALPSQIVIKCGDKTANGTNVLQILALDAQQGSVLEISAEGGDEDGALAIIKEELDHRLKKYDEVSVLKIAFFGAKDYDRIFFSELARDIGEGTYNCDIKYFNTRLTPETAGLAKGFDAVCIFVNDECPRSAVEKLEESGSKIEVI